MGKNHKFGEWRRDNTKPVGGGRECTKPGCTTGQILVPEKK
jgi:hypothetical protein